ncbi:hypothetical protein GPJ56_009222 [Histomonas meleagridis]|uniref:uncharacterized protein n=1 Tax=Histomonas meleagridis TaxID=135588 RepID=UPI00355A3934|nr:hypothetical protein GPJ56_009222 [Histomonas meleagridis]KAH0801594.1 hypothetical protein GO595_005593 [Histomonas meleagridis]
MHRRQWRVKQLDNSIFDIKTTIAATNNQINEERNYLDELNREYDSLKSERRKLINDAKMLEGLTGIPVEMPVISTSELAKEIQSLSKVFRNKFSKFYLEMPQLNQELETDPTLLRDSKILVSTLRDYVSLSFDSRAAEANFSKQIANVTQGVGEIEKQMKSDEKRIDDELASQRARIEESTNRMRESIQQQGKNLRKQGDQMMSDLQNAHNERAYKVSELEGQKRRLQMRKRNLITQGNAIKENMKCRIGELEFELNQLENRIDAIRNNQNVVDAKLINIALILSKKSALIDRAIRNMRKEIADFNNWCGI